MEGKELWTFLDMKEDIKKEVKRLQEKLKENHTGEEKSKIDLAVSIYNEISAKLETILRNLTCHRKDEKDGGAEFLSTKEL